MNAQDEINEILRLAGLPQILDEATPSAKRLLPMFQGFINLVPQGEYRRKYEALIAREVEWARRVLDREDRIIWYLRYIQLGLLSELPNEMEDNASENVELINALRATAEKKSKQLAMKSNAAPVGIENGIRQQVIEIDEHGRHHYEPA